MTLIVLPLIQFFVPGTDVGNSLENTADSFEKIKTTPVLSVLLLVFLVSCLLYNLCGVAVTFESSAIHHTFLDATRTFLIWIASVVTFYKFSKNYGEPLSAFSILQLFGFVLLIYGQLLYEGVFFRKNSERQQPLGVRENSKNLTINSENNNFKGFPLKHAKIDNGIFEPLINFENCEERDGSMVEDGNPDVHYLEDGPSIFTLKLEKPSVPNSSNFFIVNRKSSSSIRLAVVETSETVIGNGKM